MSKNVDTIYYLTPMQHGMLHHSQRDRASGVYVEQFSCVLSGALDVERFRRAWSAVVHRHDVLKTLFIRLHEERPMQVVRKRVSLPFEFDDWRGLDGAQQQHRFGALLRDDRARGFDPGVAPLMRLHLAALGDLRHRFLWTYHHAILDGWSMPILLDEVFRCYASGATVLPAASPDFRQHVAWLRQQDGAAMRAFWREALKGFRTPLQWAPSVAPAASAASAATQACARRVTVHGVLPAAWTDAAAGLCRAQRITLNTLCQGAWSVLLGLYGDSEDIVHGMVVSGRPAQRPGADAMVGLFINTLPARARLRGEMPLMDWLRQLQSSTAQAERHAHSPLAEVLQCTELPRQQALFDTLYVFENYPGQAAFRAMAAAQGLAVDDLRAVEETNYGLALIVVPGDGLRFSLTCDTARFCDAAVERMASQYRALLERIVRCPDERVQDLALEGAAAVSSHEPPVRPPGTGSLHALLARHAARAPGQPAFVGAASSVDYRAFERRIERALGRWARLGYRPGERVLVLANGDPVAGLVMLLSGLAHGIDCVLPDEEQPLDALWRAGAAAWGPEAPAGCVTAGACAARPAELRCDDFDAVDAAYGVALAAPPAVPDPSRGACSLVGRGPQGDWTLLRYEQPQLLRAAAWFAAAYPVAQARDVALAQSPWRHATLWTALSALAAGLTLRPLDGADGDHVAHRAAAAGIHWHSVHLGSAQTQALAASGAAPPAAVRTDHWIADAASLTEAGARRLSSLAPTAHLCCEWRWPAHSLPHASSRCEVPDAGPLPTRPCRPVAGATLRVLDRRLRPAAEDARGRLAVSGPSVPAAWLRAGVPDRGACLWSTDGTMLLTGVPAWVSAGACHAPWAPEPQVASGPREAGDPGSEAGPAPRDETESALHAIWCELLKRERIGVDEDYFDLGGQSLLAAVMLYRIEEKLGVPVAMETLLRFPTIAGLARALRSGEAASDGARPDLAKEAVLADDVVPASAWRPGAAQAIFLTGATGFLGVHLLADLLEKTPARVHCLVRAAGDDAGRLRLAEALKAHGLWQESHASRIVAVPGELAQPLFGLSPQQFDELAQQVDAVYHNGAVVNFVYPYASLKPVNVRATEDVLRLACRHHAKPVHYISTVGVLDRAADSIPEQLAVPLHERLMGGYEQSKWVAEQLVCSAAQRGLPVSIYRPSRIVGHSRSGRMNTDDLFCRLIKGIVLLGRAPVDTGFDNMLPVDLASRIIVDASLHPAVRGQAVHVVNPQWHSMNTVIDAIEARGHAIERLDYDRWLEQLASHAKREPSHPLAMLVPVLRKLNPVADPTVGRRLPIEAQHMGLWAADALADGWRPVDEWLRLYFDHFEASGYLRRPAPGTPRTLSADPLHALAAD